MSPLDQPIEELEPERPKGEMPFLEHLEELRRRILKSLGIVIVMTIVALYFSDHIMRWFIAPLGGVKLHVTEVTGSFTAYIKIALLSGLVVSLPFVFYQLWAFVSPGLYPKEKRMVLPFVVIATILFLCGTSFCYYLVLPWALKFMIGFSGDLLAPIVTINSYISFTGMLLLAFGLTFEMPVIAFLLRKLGIITSHMLVRGRRIAIVVILLAAGILTPTPDVLTQLLLAVPMYVLYEASIIIVRLTGRRR